MLEDIHIKNFALIDEASLDFKKGFTILSGETGAGKSILIGAISFLLGGKSSADLVPPDASEARVSGNIFLNKNEDIAKEWLLDHAIEYEDDRVLLRRVVKASGKSSAWIGDSPVTRGELSEFTSFFIDIHGQHEHQSLIKIASHRKFLDSFAGITEEVLDFTKQYTKLVEKRSLLEEMSRSEQDRKEKIELLEFSLKEITDAQLREGEDVLLEAEEKKLFQFENLYSDIDAVSKILMSDTGNVVGALKKAVSFMEHASSVDSSLKKMATRIDSVYYESSDIAEEIRSLKQQLIFDPGRLEEVQKRNAELFLLKKKYGSSASCSISEVIDYGKKARLEIDALINGEKNKTHLKAEVSGLEKILYACATDISKKRIAAAKKFSCSVEKVLFALGMSGTQFYVRVGQKKASEDESVQACSPFGIDDVEFMISANKGSAVKPLAKIASGGELSRVMLALKTVLNDSDEVATLIFDEIDTGIGGEVAVTVGRHLKALAKNRQILCITHLASIASFADTQIKIEKSMCNDRTATSVRILSEGERVCEIARMLSGDADSVASFEHAKELLKTGRE